MIDRRFGFIAIIGEPNVGKSTLVNSLVGTKLAIVTHKAQTTRSNMIGLAINGIAQMAFIDTPGIFETKKRLDKAMVKSAWSSIHGADIITVMVQPKSVKRNQINQILQHLNTIDSSVAPKALVINKIDLVHREELLGITNTLTQMFDFDKVFMVSAKHGNGLQDLFQWYATQIPLGEWHFPADQFSDKSVQSLACEITREKLLLHLHQEIPYTLTVETERWQNLKSHEVRIDQNIIVSKQSHKQMIIGKKGECIKRVGIEAKQEIKQLLGHNVHLFLQVKVRQNWMNESPRYAALGLEFPKD